MLNFNTVSPVYDLLARMVFGKTLEKAKISQLGSISDGQTILFIGGGTGATLNYLNGHFNKLKVDYVEMSSGMIKKAKMRSTGNLSIDFHNLPIEDFEGHDYDIVLTEFFFDLFSTEEIDKLVLHISNKLGPDGLWIDTDFRNTSNILHKTLMAATYMFFRMMVNLKVKRLVDHTDLLGKNKLTVKSEKIFRDGLVTSRLIIRN